jgi:hypothetical protein
MVAKIRYVWGLVRLNGAFRALIVATLKSISMTLGLSADVLCLNVAAARDTIHRRKRTSDLFIEIRVSSAIVAQTIGLSRGPCVTYYLHGLNVVVPPAARFHRRRRCAER